MCVLAVLTVSGCATHGHTDPAAAGDAAAECLARRGEHGVPARAFTTDGCSAWPDGDWGHCCETHDAVYWCGGDAAQRRAADKALRQCIATAGHPVMAGFMYPAVRIGGARIWPLPWRWAYGWPWIGPTEREPEQ